MWIDLEVRGRTADGVVDPVLHADYAGNLFDGCGDAWGKLVKQLWVRGEELDLDGLRRVRKVADHVLQHLRELHVELRHRSSDLGMDVGDDLVDTATAFAFELHAHVAGVGFCDGSETELQTCAAARALDLRGVAQNLFDAVEHGTGRLQ